MRAVVVHGPGDLRVDEVTDPTPGAGEVLVRMAFGGICGSDIHYWKHGVSGTAVLRNPMVLGHEVSGTVEALGAGVSGVEAGTAVTLYPVTIVGDEPLPARIAGRDNLYPRVRYFGSAAFDPHTDGGFSQLKVVRADQLRPLPSGVSLREGAVAEPLAVAMHAVNRSGGVAGQSVLVNGVGPIGALVVAAAKHAGAAHVIASDVADSALAVAKAMGADEVVNVRSGQLPTDVEVTFDASGFPGAIGGLLLATARGGVLVQVGNLPGGDITANLGQLVTREITWVGSYRFVGEMDEALAAMADGLDVEPLLTHTFSLDEAQQAMETAADRTTGSSKVLLDLG